MIKRVSALLIFVIILSCCSCTYKSKYTMYGYSYEFSPFSAKTPLELSAVSMTHQTLIATSDGNIIYDAYSKGIGIADIERKVTDTQTVCTVRLGEDIYFADGTRMTAKDVLFSMYVYGNIDYEGWSLFGESKLDGLREHQFATNSTLIKEVSETEVETALATETELLHNEIVLPALRREASRIRTVYSDPSFEDKALLEKYPEAWRLFEYYYSLDKSKDMSEYACACGDWDEVVTQIAKMYGGDYRTLGEKTGEDYSAKARRAVYNKLMWDKMGVWESDRKSNGAIRGIDMLDEFTLEITVNSTDEKDLLPVLGIFVAPCEYYSKNDGVTFYEFGDEEYFFISFEAVAESYNLSAEPMGAGEYVMTKYNAGAKYLEFTRNPYYYPESEGERYVRLYLTYDSGADTSHRYYTDADEVTEIHKYSQNS